MRAKKDSLAASAKLLVHRLDDLGRISDEADRLTRTFLSPAMKRANELVGKWMREAGLVVRGDTAGNLIGRKDGASPRAKTLLLGSHLDTVRNAGRFDGALGVVLPVVALAELQRREVELPFAVEVIGFSEEEAVRFPGAYIGSKAFAGKLRAADLAMSDASGRMLRDVLEAHTKQPFVLPKRAHPPRDLLGYLEVHIEQGPVLEAKKLAVGVVSAIANQSRGRLTFRGKAGHAGTTPMNLRRDALVGASEFVTFAEKFARDRSPLVATVGTITVPSGATNVIPGETILSLDVRHPDNRSGEAAVAELVREAQRISKRRGLTCEWQLTMQHRATPCSDELNELLGRSVKTVQKTCPWLVSGAGHDAVVIAELAPVAMLFVRSREGLSHHPDEYTSPADLEIALRVVVDFLTRMARLS